MTSEQPHFILSIGKMLLLLIMEVLYFEMCLEVSIIKLFLTSKNFYFAGTK